MNVWRVGVAENLSFITQMKVTEPSSKLNHYDLIGPINTVSWESWVTNYMLLQWTENTWQLSYDRSGIQ